jgi:hypothetical protein
MVKAMRYPEAKQGRAGEGKKNSSETEPFSKNRLSNARTVLHHSRTLAELVVKGITPLDRALGNLSSYRSDLVRAGCFTEAECKGSFRDLPGHHAAARSLSSSRAYAGVFQSGDGCVAGSPCTPFHGDALIQISAQRFRSLASEEFTPGVSWRLQ